MSSRNDRDVSNWCCVACVEGILPLSSDEIGCVEVEVMFPCGEGVRMTKAIEKEVKVEKERAMWADRRPGLPKWIEARESRDFQE